MDGAALSSSEKEATSEKVKKFRGNIHDEEFGENENENSKSERERVMATALWVSVYCTI